MPQPISRTPDLGLRVKDVCLQTFFLLTLSVSLNKACRRATGNSHNWSACTGSSRGSSDIDLTLTTTPPYPHDVFRATAKLSV